MKTYMLKYPILAKSQSIFYVHQASMVVDYCTQYEQNPPIHLPDITTSIQNLGQNGHKCYILVPIVNFEMMYTKIIIG